MTDVARFRALGRDVAVCGADTDAVANLLECYDAAFNRSRLDSELTAVNAAPNPVVRVSPLFATVVRAAIAAAGATAWLVDPTLGGAIEASGDNSDVPSIGHGGPWRPAVLRRPDALALDRLLLRRSPGLLLDLDGVATAHAVDAARGLIAEEGFVAVGGDLAVRGHVEVLLPAGGTVGIVRGGLATRSGTGPREQHRLVDPRTGRVARSCWRDVTVAAATCLDADVAAKAAFLLGVCGPEWLDERGLAGRFVGHYDEILENATWSRAYGPVPVCI